MLESNNDDEPEAALTKVKDLLDATTQLTMSSKDMGATMAYEFASTLRLKEQPNEDYDEVTLNYEDDDLPMLESDRPSCATSHDPITLMTTMDERTDRLRDRVPEGELHVWVYEARQLSAQWPLTDAVYNKHGLRVRCTLLGATQQSPRNNLGSMSNPVWRQSPDEARNGKSGHFAWALGQPEDATSTGVDATFELSECRLEINLLCGEHLVGSAYVELEDLLLPSKAWTGGNQDTNEETRLSSHWLPLARNAGLLQISLEFAPSRAFQKTDDFKMIIQEHKTSDASLANAPLIDYNLRQRSTCFEPRGLAAQYLPVPWHDKLDLAPSNSKKVRITSTGGVTMYVPTQEKIVPSNDNKNASTDASTTSFGRLTNDEQEQLLDKQLWDLYHYGISDAAPKVKDANTNVDFTSKVEPNRFNSSISSRHASTCASDVLAYNELIQDMEGALQIKKELRPTSNGKFAEVEQDQPQVVKITRPKSPIATPRKLHQKFRRLSKSTLNLIKPLDRLHSFCHDAKARASNSSLASSSSIEHTSRRKKASSPKNSTVSPEQPLALKRDGIVLFDPQNLFCRVPFQPSTSRDQALEATVKTEQAAEAGPRRRSLPVNTLAIQSKQTQQQQRKRSLRPLVEKCHGEMQASLLANVDPPLLSRAQSGSLHSLTDVYLPKNGDVLGVPVMTAAKKSFNNPATQRGATNRVTTRRQLGSNVIYINGAPLCVGKSINVGSVPGVVRYIGTTRFATGTWVGIELYERRGDNSGIVDGEKYFNCAPDHGIFIRASRLDLSV
ncbi:hypothetical protein CCR75_001434 [Bremia lactucae]|uniref:CAP-Gly domain-containing protein n=1 Tax=Bremia lactucae TaxID=4779 RepID=A0A976IDP4_BRELC|nr:hypothetical protein CCR75_001434 [Bremia lactucae]